MADYSLIPVEVPQIQTRHRRIQTALPVPESVPLFEELARSEPRSMSGQPPVFWHSAEGSYVRDAWGNQWIDWSSGVLITNAGHGHPEICRVVQEIVERPLLASYVFRHKERVDLTRMLREISPDPSDYRVFLLSTGSEATENCIKLAKTWAREKVGPHKRFFISFQNAFHGRTLGAQLAGGMPRLKTWIGDLDPTYVQVPFPDGYKNTDTSFDGFLAALKAQNVDPDAIAGVMSETYQGVGPDFMPEEYARKLEAFCREHRICLIMDEVQAGFGRTGKMFGFEHYGIQPDLIACGKGISSSLPISAVIGRNEIMDLYAPGSMTSTHSASPLATVAAIENLKIILRDRLPERAARMGEIMNPELQRVQRKYPERLGCFQGRGLVAGIQVVKPGTREPDAPTALAINLACFHKGLLMFAPVGIGGECLKVSPPLTIPEEVLRESLSVFEESVDEVLG